MKKPLIAAVFAVLMVFALGWPATQAAAEEVHSLQPTTLAQGEADHPAPVSDHGDAHEEAGLLTPDLGMVVWQIVLFVLLLAVLGIWVWPVILRGLQEREGKIRGDLENAEQARAEANQALEQYKQQLAEARKEAHQMIEQSRADAHQVAAGLKEQAQGEITQMRERAQHEIRAAKEQAVAEIYEQTAILATQVAGRILQREINADDQQTLVKGALDELGRSDGVRRS